MLRTKAVSFKVMFTAKLYTFDITRNKPFTRLGFIFQIKLKGDFPDVELNLASFNRKRNFICVTLTV